MAIDKITPRFLVSDEDERLLQAGAMTDALNVTISEDGEGSEGVIKNVKGTIAGTAVAGSALTATNNVTIIGQVSDSQRGKMYFFVSDDDAHSEDAIYQYDTTENEYKIVFKSTWLNFESDKFVKVDVLNGAFQQDGVIQTVLYFTDNLNEPRKINVDRALAGDYNDISDDQLDYSLKAIKAPQVIPPSFNFDTDLSIPVNNFTGEVFQFATQYIYKDGEESAISPYSALAYPDHIASSGLEGDDSGQLFFTDNKCEINVNWSKGSNKAISNPKDVKKLRLLGRSGNDGSFFVIDEFDPNSDLSRTVHSSNSIKIYDSASGVYQFYNNGLYGTVDTNTVNKAYDNVPRLARGQAISGNRIFYSNYLEGRPNHSISAAITPKYQDEATGGAVLFSSGETAFITETATDWSTTNNYKLELDFLGPSAFSASTNVVEGGSLLGVKFNFNFKVDLLDNAGGIATGTIFDTESTPNSYNVKLGDPQYRDSAVGLLTPSAQTPSFTTSFAVPEDVTLSSFVTAFQAQLAESLGDTEYEIDYTLGGNAAQVTVEQAPLGAPIAVGTSFNCIGSVKATWAFDIESVSNTGIRIVPYIKHFKANNALAVIGTYSGGSIVSGTLPAISVNKTFANQTTQRLRLYQENSIDLTSSTTQVFRNFQAQPSFKFGSHHDFGVVYYDKYNRSGNVNKIGGFYSEFPGERGAGVGKGAVSALLQFTDDAPDWAERWQVVYGGMKSFDSVFTYTTGGAYAPLKENSGAPGHESVNSVGTINPQKKQLYVSLKTLDKYTSEKGASRSYSFTEGDKLRVVKYSADGGFEIGGFTYPMASDGSSIIEFNVVGVALLGDNIENPLSFASAGSVEKKHQGTFVIIEAPQIAAGIKDAGGTNELKYPGWDWFAHTGTDYPIGSATEASHWGHHSVVEIVSPRKTKQQVYYEIGHSQKVGDYKGTFNSNHGPDVYLDCADTYLKTTACSTALYDANWNDTATPEEWSYINLDLESQSVSDFIKSKDWDRGRPHIYFESAASTSIFNGITYSDAYSEGVANLAFSSFNPSLGNFESLDSRYGAINYIGNYNDDLATIQENKLALVPVGKNIIQYAEGSGNVAISTSVLGKAVYSSGDYGCGNHPEAVLIQDNDVFFVDESRQKVLRLVGGQLTPISDKGMSSAFEDFFKAGYTKYVSGFDPRINTYFITGKNGSTGETIGYDVNRGVWQSKYSFVPDIYANQDNMLYSALYNTNGNAFYRHDDNAAPPTNRNMFYEASTAADSMVEVVSKVSPSRVKVYNALSYEGDSALWDMNTGVKTDLGQTSGTITSWSKKEGSYYSAMPRAINGTSQYLFIGVAGAVSSSSAVIPLASSVRINRLPANVIGLPVYYKDASGAFTIEGLGARTLSAYTSTSLTLIFAPSAGDATDKELYVEIPDSGDPMRGHWAKIKLTNSSNTKHELYCINTHVTDSKSHHPLGQQ